MLALLESAHGRTDAELWVSFCLYRCRLRMTAEKDLRIEQERKELEAAAQRRRAKEGDEGYR